MRSSVLSAFAALLLTLALCASPARAQTSDPSQQEKLEYYSLYYEDYKNENYKSALRGLRWMLKNDPTFVPNSAQGDDRHYRRAYNAYSSLAKSASDPETKHAYLDSALAIAKRAVPEVEAAGGDVEKYDWVLKRGRLLFGNADVLSGGKEEAIAAFREAYQMNSSEIDPWYLDKIIRDYYGNDDKEGALAFLDDLKANRSDEEPVQELLDKWYPQFFDTPGERISFLEGQLEENPESGDLMSQLLTLYEQQGLQNKASRLQTRILEVDPTPELYRTVASTRLDDEEPQKALDLYQKLLNLPDAEPTARDYYNMGVANQQLSRLTKARSYFRKAINTDSGFGPAYISIANLYAGAVSNCTGGGSLELQDRAVYWLAVDYFQKAKQADASVASTANQNIARYREYFPSQEDIFFKGWEPGQSYTIDYGCYSWIGETTSVKSP